VKYPCPCCGHLVFAGPPGSYEICQVCFWEDDGIQLRWPNFAGGANRPSLIESQRNFIELGAMEARFVGNVRPATTDEPIDPEWRPIDERDDLEVWGEERAPWPEDLTVLYYWRRSSWPGSARH
jgi:hypothetical protein